MCDVWWKAIQWCTQCFVLIIKITIYDEVFYLTTCIHTGSTNATEKCTHKCIPLDSNFTIASTVIRSWNGDNHHTTKWHHQLPALWKWKARTQMAFFHVSASGYQAALQESYILPSLCQVLIKSSSQVVNIPKTHLHHWLTYWLANKLKFFKFHWRLWIALQRGFSGPQILIWKTIYTIKLSATVIANRCNACLFDNKLTFRRHPFMTLTCFHKDRVRVNWSHQHNSLTWNTPAKGIQLNTNATLDYRTLKITVMNIDLKFYLLFTVNILIIVTQNKFISVRYTMIFSLWTKYSCQLP